MMLKRLFRGCMLFTASFLCCYVTYSQSSWNQVNKVVSQHREDAGYFGSSVAISGDYAIVGAYGEDTNLAGTNPLSGAGAAYIFKRVGYNWELMQKIVITNRQAGNFFGCSVAIDGDYAIIGAYSDDLDLDGENFIGWAGAAYIFKLEGETWVQKQKLIAPEREEDDYFGFSVSISGDQVVVGAYMENQDANEGNMMANSGSAYVFKREGETWSHQQKIVASDRAANDYFAYKVAISGNYIIAGAHQEDHNADGGGIMYDAGAAYIFEKSGDTWVQVQKLVAADGGASDYFGHSVSIDSSGYAVVGADREDEDELGGNTMGYAGSAYVFKKDGDAWVQQQKLVSQDRTASDYFGTDVDMEGDQIIISANRSSTDVEGENYVFATGAAYIFKRAGETWSQQQKIVASDRGNSDYYGDSVGISGDYSIAGVRWEDEDVAGENTISNTGSAYLYYHCNPDVTVAELDGALTVAYTGGTYQWLDCDNNNEPIAEGTGQSFTPLQSGTYAVQVTHDYGCTVISACTDFCVTAQIPVTVTGGTISTTFSAVSYQWLDCDNNNEPVEGATEAQFSPAEDGTYALSVTEASGCVSVSECAAVTALSVNNPALQGGLSLYPNPATNVLYINNAITKASVYTVTGQLITETYPAQGKTAEINLSEIKEGVYLIRAVTATGSIFTGKFIKTN